MEKMGPVHLSNLSVQILDTGKVQRSQKQDNRLIVITWRW
jgi:hypothetical protein